ncbi:kinesin [Chloropicon primus]|uniref:Kinesin-like protein n=1 Tax=Chloropicon primus TaxID=1764295 RepID=A0A5B8MMM2_9CHLO|nr:kinesin [Chloropicon primus]UPR00508.1 kinesin [Chloropicon primus]|eukprot:QDZ21294.1 kinesin [Chloropicon primus]
MTEGAMMADEGGEESGPFASNGNKKTEDHDEELESIKRVTGEDGVSYETLEDAEAGNKIQAVCPMVVASREVKEKKKVISFTTTGLKDVYLWIDIFGFAVLDSHGKVTRSVPYPMLASWMIDNDLFQVQLVNKKGKQKVYTYLTGYHTAVKIKNRLWEYIDLYLKHPKAVEALQSFCQAIEEGNVVSTDLLKEGIPLDKEAFIDESLTKAKKIPLGTNKDGTPKKPAKAKAAATSSKSPSKDTQNLARAEAELRTLREALQKALEERDEAKEKCEGLDAQLELLQLESKGGGDGGEGASAKAKQLEEEAKQLKEDLEFSVRERDNLSKQLENAMERMQSMESGDAGNTQQEVLHYQQEAQQLAALMEEQHSIIDDLVKAKSDLEEQVAQEKGGRQQAEAIAEAATNEAASAIAEAQAAGEQMQGEQMQVVALGAGAILEGCEGLRRDLATVRSEAEALSTAVPLMSAFALRQLSDFMASGAFASMRDAMERYKRECKLRKQLYNQLIELRGNIRVFCRVRPLFGKEIEEEEEDVTRFPEEDEITVLASDGSYSRAKTYEFDKVFGPDSSQTVVFQEVAPLIASVLDGYNFCIFAYGQTGSGKTHTMEGPRDDPGVNTRAIAELFRLAEERGEDYEINVSASVLEIYNEQLRDLLVRDNSKKLEAKLAKDGSVHVPGLTAMKVGTPQDIVKVMEVASKNRAVSATNMNEHSSRSHAMLSVSVMCRNRISKQEHRGKLHLVDLAGSERVGKSEATGARLKEAQAINKSLSSLGDVIQALSAKKGHVPFRNSKLTYVLQDSLGGHSKVLMFVQASPAGSNTSETRCSLDFAARARNVELGQAKQNTVRYGDGGDNGHAKH